MVDLAADLRNYMRGAAAEFLLEQVQTVVDEITNASIDCGENYIPEVTYDQRGVLSKNAEHFRDLDAWTNAVLKASKAEVAQAYQTDTDPGDAADVARRRTCWRDPLNQIDTPPR